jgi:hypothetical protein
VGPEHGRGASNDQIRYSHRTIKHRNRTERQRDGLPAALWIGGTASLGMTALLDEGWVKLEEVSMELRVDDVTRAATAFIVRGLEQSIRGKWVSGGAIVIDFDKSDSFRRSSGLPCELSWCGCETVRGERTRQYDNI